MNKKIIFSLIAGFSLSGLLTPPVLAEEGIMPISENEAVPISDDVPVEGVINPEEIDDSNEPTTTIDVDTNVNMPEVDSTTETNTHPDSELENDIDHNGTSGEPEVVCADPNEPGCEDEAIDPEMWPLYLSLGALGFTILFVIIINLINRRKK